VVITKNLAEYVKKKAINLSAMSRATGISYGILYASLASKSRTRSLTADEAFLICKFLEMKIEDFADAPLEVETSAAEETDSKASGKEE
jgi:hypothetical protein